MNTSRNPKLIAVAGGKGGAGKTAFACMLGACLAGFDRKAILIDLDFSGANVRDYLNLPSMEKSLNTYFAGRSTLLTDIVQQTSFDKLDAITLFSNRFTSQACKPWQKRRLFRDMFQLNADYIILDLGSASSTVGLDAFLMADHGVLLSTNDMFSIINTYSFIRSALLRSIKRRFYDSPQVLRILDECGLLVDGKCIKPLHAVIDQFDAQTQDKFKGIDKLWTDFHPQVVLNFADETDNVDDFFLLGPVAKDLLNIDLEYWGHVRYDESVDKAIRQRKPEQLLAMNGKASEDVVRLAVRNIISSEFLMTAKRTPWFSKDVNIFDMFSHVDSLTCTSKCFAWDNCPLRSNGGTCAKMNIEMSRRV
jgi:flagellar biosynthesis protein FlhG